jgi:hypothetical protein
VIDRYRDSPRETREGGAWDTVRKQRKSCEKHRTRQDSKGKIGSGEIEGIRDEIGRY